MEGFRTKNGRLRANRRSRRVVYAPRARERDERFGGRRAGWHKQAAQARARRLRQRGRRGSVAVGVRGVAALARHVAAHRVGRGRAHTCLSLRLHLRVHVQRAHGDGALAHPARHRLDARGHARRRHDLQAGQTGDKKARGGGGARGRLSEIAPTDGDSGPIAARGVTAVAPSAPNRA